MPTNRLSESTIELAPAMFADEGIDPLEITEHIPIVLVTEIKKPSDHEMHILRSCYMAGNSSSTAQLVNDKFRANKWERLVKMMAFKKQGIYGGTVQFITPAPINLEAATGKLVKVRIEALGNAPLKDLEQAFANPDVPADWAPHAIPWNSDATLPATMKVLIIKWRPTNNKIKRALGMALEWSIRIGLIVVAGIVHDSVVDKGALNIDPEKYAP